MARRGSSYVDQDLQRCAKLRSDLAVRGCRWSCQRSLRSLSVDLHERLVAALVAILICPLMPARSSPTDTSTAWLMRRCDHVFTLCAASSHPVRQSQCLGSGEQALTAYCHCIIIDIIIAIIVIIKEDPREQRFRSKKSGALGVPSRACLLERTSAPSTPSTPN